GEPGELHGREQAPHGAADLHRWCLLPSGRDPYLRALRECGVLRRKSARELRRAAPASATARRPAGYLAVFREPGGIGGYLSPGLVVHSHASRRDPAPPLGGGPQRVDADRGVVPGERGLPS